jgi:hypothetical protein
MKNGLPCPAGEAVHPCPVRAPGLLLLSHTEGTEGTEGRPNPQFSSVGYRFPSFTVHSKFYCRPHAEGAEGAEDAENRREGFLRVLHFSASSA